MLFSSMTFISIFLPVLIIIYFLIRQELKNIVLLVFSLLFYAWGEPKFVIIMLLTILVTYAGGLVISKTEKHKKTALIITIVSILSFLFYFKYFNFMISILNDLFHSHIDFLKVILPLGISFYTFQALSYIIDIYRGECKVQKNLYKLALYISFFPQLIAGPIIKYNEICDQIEHRQETLDDVVYGLKRFVIGLSKKVILANNLGIIADKIFIQPPFSFPWYIAWLGAICFTFQLMYDFIGYSDMAIGLCRIFGFKIPENFDYPLISKSMTEMWRRWHISLCTWFRNYVYFPLGGNRKGQKRQIINILIVFLLVGLWHGASWAFVFWGLYIGVLTVLEKILGISKESGKIHINFLKHIYFLLNGFIMVTIFRCDNLHYSFDYIKNMFGLIPSGMFYPLEYYFLGWWEISLFIIAIICCMPVFKGKNIPAFTHIVLLILCIMELAMNTYNPFLYFRF